MKDTEQKIKMVSYLQTELDNLWDRLDESHERLKAFIQLGAADIVIKYERLIEEDILSDIQYIQKQIWKLI